MKQRPGNLAHSWTCKMGKKAALYLVVCMFEIQLNNKIMEIGATCTSYMVGRENKTTEQ